MSDLPPEPSRSSIRRELPGGPPEITAAQLVKAVRMAWRQAKLRKCTDAISLIFENTSMQRAARPRVLTMSSSTLRGLAAVCAVQLANAMKGDGTDDPRLLAAHKELDDYVRNPPRTGGRLPL